MSLIVGFRQVRVIQSDTPVCDRTSKEIRVKGAVNRVTVLELEGESAQGCAVQSVEFPRENRRLLVLLYERPHWFLPDRVRDLLLHTEDSSGCLEVPGLILFVTVQDHAASGRAGGIEKNPSIVSQEEAVPASVDHDVGGLPRQRQDLRPQAICQVSRAACVTA